MWNDSRVVKTIMVGVNGKVVASSGPSEALWRAGPVLLGTDYCWGGRLGWERETRS